MGYRVGNQCFATKEAATDYQMSSVVPIITADGKLLHPVKTGGTWTFAGQTANLHFGECDPAADFKQGATIAGQIVIVMIVAYCARLLIGFVQNGVNDV